MIVWHPHYVSTIQKQKPRGLFDCSVIRLSNQLKIKNNKKNPLPWKKGQNKLQCNRRWNVWERGQGILQSDFWRIYHAWPWQRRSWLDRRSALLNVTRSTGVGHQLSTQPPVPSGWPRLALLLLLTIANFLLVTQTHGDSFTSAHNGGRSALGPNLCHDGVVRKTSCSCVQWAAFNLYATLYFWMKAKGTVYSF